MPFYMLLPILVAVAYLAVNLGSKNKVPVAKIALTIALVCVIAYFAYPLFAPLVNELMQLGTHFQFQ